MIYFIHGDDTAAIHKKIEELIPANPKPIRLQGDKSGFAEFIQAVEGGELFATKKTIILENANKLKDLPKIIEELKKYERTAEITIILFQEGALSKKFFIFKTAKAFQFNLPKYLFEFLDNLQPGNGLRLHESIKSMDRTVAAELLLFMMERRIRELLIFKAGNVREFKDTEKLAIWQISKLEKQARLWKNEPLMDFYEKLFQLEVRTKTSTLTGTLYEEIDTLVVAEL